MARRLAILAAAGAVLSAIVIAAEAMALAPWLEAISTAVYRVVFFALGPLRFALSGFRLPIHRPYPIWQTLLVCVALPFLVYGAWRLLTILFRAQEKPGRRAFLAACGAAPLAVGSYPVLASPSRLWVARYDCTIADLPESLDGLRVAHLSDTHYGPFLTLHYLRRAVAMANSLDPDLVVLTGDYVLRTPKAIEPGIEIFKDLRPRLGTVGVLGNHDHWEGADACRAAFAGLGIPLVDNGRCYLTASGLTDALSSEQALCLAGLGDLWENSPSLKRALEGVPESMPRLLLSHNPDTAELANDGFRVDLMLSGHTHGGQVRLPGFSMVHVPSRYGEKYAGGFCQGPWCPVIVSRGVGLAGLPLRIGVPPEIGLVRLRRG